MILGFDNSNQSSQPGDLSDPLLSFVCPVSDYSYHPVYGENPQMFWAERTMHLPSGLRASKRLPGLINT